METCVIKGEGATRRVWIDGVELVPGPSQAVFNHSPDGFNWGYAGSGPAQLALAICLAVGMSREDALSRYQSFKFEQVARWDGDFEVMLSRKEIVGYGEPGTSGH